MSQVIKHSRLLAGAVALSFGGAIAAGPLGPGTSPAAAQVGIPGSQIDSGDLSIMTADVLLL
jgi:hypothetical protein